VTAPVPFGGEQRDYITVGLVGGPLNGQRVELPLECPCCGQSATGSGSIWTAPDGSLYVLNPEIDVEHARFLGDIAI
jgi:hypothetical protein